MYSVPEKYYLRIHHSRPRFKSNQEEVLIYIATEISKLGKIPKAEFKVKANNAIRLFPGNTDKRQKTIDNWRTEISSFFGLIQRNSDDTLHAPSILATKLANEQDLLQFYKYFLFTFQYPGGHLKSQENKKLIEQKVLFKPAQYILKVLEEGEKITKKRFYLTKAEVTHCIFNDLRVTRDKREVKDVVKLILYNRTLDVEYDWSGDVIRYAGDIMDYMCIADLLKTHDGQKHYINNTEKETIASFISDQKKCDIYDPFYDEEKIVTSSLTSIAPAWFDYVNTDLGEDLFKTDLYKYLGIKEASYTDLVKEQMDNFQQKIANKKKLKTKDIGDFGEGLVLSHEKMRVLNGGRDDLLHLIKKMPTEFAVGYDIQSVELDALKRYIEVKTTISSKKLNFLSFHLTSNEWDTASTLRKSYFVYRLGITEGKLDLHLIQDPVGLYKDDLIDMSPRDGADIRFSKVISQQEELLIWK